MDHHILVVTMVTYNYTLRWTIIYILVVTMVTYNYTLGWTIIY